MPTNREQFPAHFREIFDALPDSIPLSAREAIAERNAVYWYDSKWELYDVRDFLKGRAEREAADVALKKEWRHTPDVMEVLRDRVARYEKEFEKPMPPEMRTTLFRELKEMGSDELLQMMPEGGKPKEPAAAVSVKKDETKMKPISEWSDDDFSAEIKKCWGKEAHELLPSKRAEYIAAITARNAGPKMHSNDVAALALAEAEKNGGRKLSAAERMTAFRVQEAAKKAAAGSR